MYDLLREDPWSGVLTGLLVVVGGAVPAGLLSAQQQWWFGGVTFAVTLGALLVADRVESLRLAAVLVTTPLLILFGWVLFSELMQFTYPFMVGVGASIVVNRVVFGLIHPVPEPRRRRKASLTTE